MIAKCFEVRDEMTFIPVMAVLLAPTNEEQHWLLARAGYRTPGESVIVTNLADARSANDCYDWPSGTMQTAHRCILDHWEMLADGDVIDCEFIRGETAVAKLSEGCEP